VLGLWGRCWAPLPLGPLLPLANCSSGSVSQPESISCPDRFGTGRDGWSSSAWAVVAAAGVTAWVEAGIWTGVFLRSSSSLSLGSSSKSSPKSNLDESGRLIISESFDDLRRFRWVACFAAASTNSFDGGRNVGFFWALEFWLAWLQLFPRRTFQEWLSVSFLFRQPLLLRIRANETSSRTSAGLVPCFSTASAVLTALYPIQCQN
jgi:hypothetical protein